MTLYERRATEQKGGFSPAVKFYGLTPATLLPVNEYKLRTQNHRRVTAIIRS